MRGCVCELPTRSAAARMLRRATQRRRDGSRLGPVLKHGPRSYIQRRMRGRLNTLHAAKAKRATLCGSMALVLQEVESLDVDPRGCDLLMGRMKPGETPVEVRRGIDVQIIPQTCV